MTESKKIVVPRAIKLAVGVLLLEAIGPAILVVGQVVDLVSGKAIIVSAGVALLALWLGAALWVTFMAKRLFEGRPWARSASLFWQLVQLAVASASFTGPGANFWIGGFLVATSVIELILLFSKEALAHTVRDRA
jgi:hypothetical protein